MEYRPPAGSAPAPGDTASLEPRPQAVPAGRPAQQSSAGARFQQSIITIHRWIGIVGCLMMLVWFISGIVLAYVRFPAMDDGEKLTVLGPIAWEEVKVSPAAAIVAAGMSEMPLDLRLEMSGPRPVYRIVDWGRNIHAVSAVTGEAIDGVSGAEALAIVRRQLGDPRATLRAADVDSDQWTTTGYWNKKRPFHIVALNDPAGTEYYVSRATGEIVLDTRRAERMWNWLGAVPHWLYFEFIRHYSHEPVWTWTIYIVASAGIFVSLSGLYIGITRLRVRMRYPNGQWTPFRGWMKWHHVTGIVGGILLALWMVSGLLTMYPGGFLEQRGLEKREHELLAGTLAADFPFAAAQAIQAQVPAAARVTFRRFAGRPLAVVEAGKGPPQLFDASTGERVSLTTDVIRDAATRIMPAAGLTAVTYLEEGDEYWHTAFTRKKLPIVRVQFDDPDGTWYHIDPETGALISVLDEIGRVDRWTVVAIHDLDFHWLLQKGVLWDVALFATTIPGILIVVTALVISFRRLQRAGLVPVGGVAARLPRTASGTGGAPGQAGTESAQRSEEVLVAFATQTGTAEIIANRVVDSLRRSGREAAIRQLGDLAAADLARHSTAIFVVSTTGDGDAPDRAMAFHRRTMRGSAPLDGLTYGLLALGDHQYSKFCSFGVELDGWLRRCGARPVFPAVCADGADDAALAQFSAGLATITGRVENLSISVAPHQPWTLVRRVHLNPGSPGGETYHLEFEPEGGWPDWQAGDVAQVVAGKSWARFKAGAGELVEREYSIASTPAERGLHLLVRKMIDGSGRVGRSSGFLCGDLSVGESIPLRIRANPGFRGPPGDDPMVLIGNGTGIAGLRAHLLRREALGHGRNWLIFGERSAATDNYYAADLQRWVAHGTVDRVDLAFSRDGGPLRYVQDVLAGRAGLVRDWVGQGAWVYVCGSLRGMAPAVNDRLESILGSEGFEALVRSGRYRRDVY